MRYILLLIACSFPAFVTAQTADILLDTLLRDISRYEETLWPSGGSGHVPTSRFPQLTATDYRLSGEEYRKFLQRLENIPEKDLDQDHRISYQLLGHKLHNEVDEIEFKRYLIPMNAEGGFYISFPYARNRDGFSRQEEYANYVIYLENYAEWLESRMMLMQEGIREGIVAPRPVIRNAEILMEGWTPLKVEESPYFAPFRNARENYPEEREKALAIIREKINPFYERFRSFLADEYTRASPEKPGVLFQTNGSKFYESRMRYYTTLPLTADSVHQLGLSEVKRIRGRMDQIIDSLAFDGSFEEFLEFLRTDPQFYARTPQELLNHAAWLSKKAEAGLPKLFSKLYSLPFTVEPVPDHIAPAYTGGRYVPGSWNSQRAGIYWVNTYKLDSRPFYTLPSLTLHEAVPGHHLQIMLSAELDLSPFRRNYYISTFGEGWGLYSEYLGEEMGMYQTPYEMFGRLTYEMWRACRLVVDTGIHAYGWTREEAVAYMQSNTALSIHEVNTEIDRYIGWPGQAVSYKIGEIKIVALRKKAEAALGSDFDVREYHEVVLGNGSVPMTLLEEQVDAYIVREKHSK